MTRQTTPITTRHAKVLFFADAQISFKDSPHTFSTFARRTKPTRKANLVKELNLANAPKDIN